MKTPRTVALVVPDLAMGGGVPTVALFLRQILSRSGRYTPHIVSLATSSRDQCSIRLLAPSSWLERPQVERRSWRGVDYVHVGAVLTEIESRRLRPRGELSRLLERHDIVQVVAGTPAWAYPVLPLDKPKMLQVATLISTEREALLKSGAGPMHLWRRFMTGVNERMEAEVLRSMDAVFVENSWMHGRLSSSLGSDRVHFAPPGIDTDFFAPGPWQPEGYILSVGRFSDPRKNVRLLFDAYARTSRRSPRTPDLMLVGAAPGGADLAYMRRLGIADRVRIVSDVAQDDLPGYYRGARLFVLSSDEEGLGLVILEAMSSGLPVVSTDCGGPSTSVADGATGFLVPVGDAEALSDAMTAVLRNDDLAREMGRHGHERAVESFSLERAGRPFLDAYDRVLGL